MVATLLLAAAALAAAPQRAAVQTPQALRQLQIAAPRITAVEPAEVTQGETTTLTVTGTNIRDGLVLSLGPGITATPVSQANGTSGRVSVTVAANAPTGSHALSARIGSREVGQPARVAVRARAAARTTPFLGQPQRAPALAPRTQGVQGAAPPQASFSGSSPNAFNFPNASGALAQYDLRNCPDHVVPCLTNERTIYIEPGTKGPEFFWWNVERVPNAGAARWQFIYSPLRPETFADDPDAGGVVRTGVQNGTHDEVDVDIDALARELKMTPIQPAAADGAAGGARPGATGAIGQRAGALIPQAGRADDNLATAGSLYFRIVPLHSVSNPSPSGRPSQLLRIVYGTRPRQDLKLPKDTYTDGPSIAVTKFEWVPYLRIDRWPSGCEDIPRDTGTNALDVVGDAFSDAWDWASKTYANVQSAVVDIAQKILPMVPRSWLNIAMQGAMMAAGLPPSIPNLDQVMDAGSDYLVETLASQIPVPASDQLAGLTVEQFKSKAEDASRQAIRAGAQQARDALSGKDVKYCQQWVRYPFAKITIRNTGHEDYHDVWVDISDSGNLFRGLDMPVPLLRRGEALTLPVVLIDRSKMNVVVHDETQLAETNEERAEERWWDDFSTKPFTFKVTLPNGTHCIGSYCEDLRRTAYTSASKIWFLEGGVSR
jgi:Quinohemoprotein amine dehydrogenase, alpha subunit domain III